MAANLNVTKLIDEGPWRAPQVICVAICGLLAIFDGFDTQAIAFVAPAIARQWSLPASDFGPIFAVGLVGLCAGAILVGPLSDRFGRKPLLMASTLIVGAFALATALAESYGTLLVLRFLTGLGLGSAMPNILTLASEYSPKRHRATIINIVSCGFPLGAVLGGAMSFKVISAFGWPAVFLIGGALPLIAAPFIAALLPESLAFLAVRRGLTEQGRRIIRRLSPTTDPATFDGIVADRDEGRKVRLGEILQGSMGLRTVLIWVVFFFNVLIMYLLINWLPLVVQQAALPPETGILTVVMLNLGGILGGIVLGRAVDKLPPQATIAAIYVAAAIAVGAIGVFLQTGSDKVTLIAFVTGFFVIGAMFCMHALTAAVYPVAARSTGLGSALGVGRFGAIAGPLIGGLMIGGALGLADAFFVLAVPLIVCAGAVLALRAARDARRAAAPEAPRP